MFCKEEEKNLSIVQNRFANISFLFTMFPYLETIIFTPGKNRYMYIDLN